MEEKITGQNDNGSDGGCGCFAFVYLLYVAAGLVGLYGLVRFVKWAWN
jgi:hypothetical protein